MMTYDTSTVVSVAPSSGWSADDIAEVKARLKYNEVKLRREAIIGTRTLNME